MTKNADTDKHKYQGHGIGFDLSGIFIHPNGEDGKNVIIFGVDMTNSKHANNKTKVALVLGHGHIQKVEDKTIYGEKMYLPNFTVANKTFYLRLHHNGDDSYLSLGNISVDFNQANRKSTGIHVYIYIYIYGFSVDYNPITNDKMRDIYRYLME